MADALLITNKPHKVDTVCLFVGFFAPAVLSAPQTLFPPAHPSVQAGPVYYSQEIQNRREFA